MKEIWESFLIFQTSKGVSNSAIRNYHTHLKGISKHLDIEMPFENLTKRKLEEMVVSMRAAGLAHNTVAAYSAGDEYFSALVSAGGNGECCGS